MILFLRSSVRLSPFPAPKVFRDAASAPIGARYASLTSAIGRGIRKSQAVESPIKRRQDNRNGRSFAGRETDYSHRNSGRGDDRNGRNFADRERNPFRRDNGKWDDQNGRNLADRERGSFTRNNERRSTPRFNGAGSVQTSKSREFSRERDSYPRTMERRSNPAFDEEEFIQTGKFRVRPSDRQNSDMSDRRNGDATPGERYASDESVPYADSLMERKKAKKISRDLMARKMKRKRGRHHTYSDTMPDRIRTHVQVPTSIPYTTPASEFIYGTSGVEAALRCTRRKIYKLYLYQAKDEELSNEKSTFRKLALAQNIYVKMAYAEWDKVMDKMAGGRPHNGCILEASPLPKLPVACLESVETSTADHFQVGLAKQSQEEADVNGADPRVPRVPRPDNDEAARTRYPLVLLLDAILDPGNLGAVMRSAYYLGVDAVVLTGRNSAPLSPVTIKASAGAAENMIILKANNEVDFIRRSRANGWRFLAADAPENVRESLKALAHPDTGVSQINSILNDAPTVLMLGGEGTGLIPRLKAQADGIISIPGARMRPELGLHDPARVDSLNVSVAAALLIERLMQVPLHVSNLSSPEKEPETSSAISREDAPRSFDFN